MRIRTDDEVYRVDAVWLGPPKATFPWRARYVAWGVGIVTFLVVLLIERRIGFGFGFFSTAWAVVITIGVTRVICKRINHERPLGAVTVMWLRELTAPRRNPQGRGGAASATAVRVRHDRPRGRGHRAQAQRGEALRGEARPRERRQPGTGSVDARPGDPRLGDAQVGDPVAGRPAAAGRAWPDPARPDPARPDPARPDLGRREPGRRKEVRRVWTSA